MALGPWVPKKPNPRVFQKETQTNISQFVSSVYEITWIFSFRCNDPTITQQLQFASSTIMPSSGLELFFDISCPSLRCRAGGPKGVQGPTVQLMTFSPFPLLSVPRTLTKVQTLLPWRNCLFTCGKSLGVWAKYKAIFMSLVDSMLQPFVCQLGTSDSNAIHAL